MDDKKKIEVMEEENYLGNFLEKGGGSNEHKTIVLVKCNHTFKSHWEMHNGNHWYETEDLGKRHMRCHVNLELCTAGVHKFQVPGHHGD